jgi:eukaryotic-like serine/threonine-protein kinase
MSSIVGGDRFRIVRRLGSGGMGVVYEADDAERGERVALKSVKQRDPDALYRLKKEFRSLADVRHPNLVRLYDLIVDRDECFFTMELVTGQDLVAYCTRAIGGEPSPDDETVRATAPRFDEQRTRACLPQLAAALIALHQAGKVHRDIKPSNVLVDRNGRVVVLDFGLATDSHRSSHESLLGQIVGTAAYMAPEQARAEVEVTPAADWYGAGAVLYQILTGAPPYAGSAVDILVAKQREDARPPTELVPTCPDDLSTLCMRLLDRDPAVRPGPVEVLRAIDARVELASLGSVSGQSTLRLFGRSAELAELRAAVDGARKGATVAVLISGEPGIGRTTVLHQLAADLRSDPESLILTGRCYRQESVPYKAVDEVIDALARHLRTLPAAEIHALIPAEIAEAAQIFPVLRRVEAIAAAHARRPSGIESPRDRLAAFDALRALVRGLALQRRVVVMIDDLQWSDPDSAVLLVELLRPLEAARLVFVGSYMTATGGDPAPILHLRTAELLRDVAIIRHELALGPLAYADSLALARDRLGPGATDLDAIARSIAGESGGSPLAIDELARVVAGGAAIPAHAHSAVTADQLIRVRVASLPDDARRLLEIVAVSGGPIPAALAHRAAGLAPEDHVPATLLRSRHLIRAVRVDRDDCFDAFHDRIRATVVNDLGDALAARHGALALAHEAAEVPRPEALAYHLSQAGQLGRAAQFALRAAADAERVLAFDRAATFLRSALAWLPEGGAQRELRARLGSALAGAGQGAAAAEAYLAAADGDDARSLEYRYLAADNLLRGGHIRSAMSLLDALAGDLGIRVGRRRSSTILALLWRRLRLRLRGTSYRPRAAEELPPLELRRVETIGTIATSLGVIDHVKGAVVQTSHLLAALSLGEDARLARALAAETMFQAAADNAKRAEKTARELEMLAQKLGDPRSLAWNDIAWGGCAHFAYRFDEAARRFGAAADRLPAAQGAIDWELTTARHLQSFALLFAGRYREAARGVDVYLPDAIRRNDLYARNIWCSATHIYKLMFQDRCDEAHEVLAGALDGGPTDAYYLAHVYADTSAILLMLYEGKAAEAGQRFDRLWQMSRAAGIHHIRSVARDQIRLRAHIEVATRDFSAAERTSAALLRTRIPYLHANAHYARAVCAHRRGDLDAARRELLETVRLTDNVGSSSLGEGARVRLGRLIGGDEGAHLVARGMAWLRDQRTINLPRMLEFVAPGLADAG